MINFEPHEQFGEPDPEVVECAIAKVLEFAQSQGISPGDFVRLLNGGMKMSDFLAAIDLAEANQNCARGIIH